ncbi:hypothetical protein BH10BDE1_BH10BDE1_00120 [soil metagenome]
MSAKPRNPKQLGLLKREKSAYGGSLRNTREGRSRGRPLATRETMHLVLRSTQAKGPWSFRNTKNAKNIVRIVGDFAQKYGVGILSMANVGNHLHLQIKLANRRTYAPFIRAITGAIAMAVTGRTRWSKKHSIEKPAKPIDSRRKTAPEENGAKKFWDYRPFTRIVQSLRARLNLNDYTRINALEGEGYQREDARFMLTIEKKFEKKFERTE